MFDAKNKKFAETLMTRPLTQSSGKRGRLTAFAKTGVLLALMGGLPGLSPSVQAQVEKQAWPAEMDLPALVGKDQHGKVWTLKNLRGRPVLLNFWATWCPPCVEEMPSLQIIADRDDGKGLVVLTIAAKETPARLHQFMKSNHLSLPVLIDPKGETSKRFNVRALPTTVLVSSDGRARWFITGSVDWTDTEAQAWLSELAVTAQR